jgi:hypothetical protein
VSRLSDKEYVKSIKYILILLVSISLFSCSQISSKKRSVASSDDGWSYVPKGRTIAIGDVHADPKAFLDILINKGVLDGNGKFVAQNIDLVLLGDFADKGPNTRGVWDVINYIEKEAGKNNSRVHAVFGNHDTVILMGNLKRMQKVDLMKFKDFDPDPVLGVKKALVSRPYKSMMRKWKGIIKIGETIYVHGGISKFIYEMHPSEINKTVKEYVIAQQEYLEKVIKGISAKEPKVPSIMSSWKFDSKDAMPDNPFWTRVAAKKNLTQKVFNRMLDYLDAKRVVVGHTPTKSKEIEKILNGKMILADTNNSSGFSRGKLSALEINEKTGELLESNNLKKGVNRRALRKIITTKIKKLDLCFEVFLRQL